MASAESVGRSPQSGNSLNWRLLAELLSFSILTVFFLFYFNRVFAKLVSIAIRAYTWKKYAANVEIQSLQISLLAGRIFFRGFRYHGKNETILIHSGHVTWRYWYRKVRDCARDRECTSHDVGTSRGSTNREPHEKEKGGLEATTNLPCRLLLEARGLEWFIYNRSPAYDAIIQGISEGDGATSGPRECVKGLNDPGPSLVHNEDVHAPPPQPDNEEQLNGTLFTLLPLGLECKKGAIIVGNDSVSCMLTVVFDKASGEVDASNCPPPDLYKQVINVRLTRPVVSMRPNPSYNGSAPSDSPKDSQPHSQRVRPHAEDRKANARKFLRTLVRPFASDTGWRWSRKQHNPSQPGRTPSYDSAEKRWLGLSRYLDEYESIEHDGWRSVEYARQATILDSPSVSIHYYWDVAGLAPRVHDPDGPRSTGSASSGSPAMPQWGLDISVQGGTVNYGPWTDRRRSELQSEFFPRLYKDATPFETPQPGNRRVATVFKVFVDIQDTITLRVPTREPSKDWKWSTDPEAFKSAPEDTKGNRKRHTNKRKAKASHSGPRIRPPGWVDFKIPADSTVSYSMDMVASKDGYHTSLDVEIRNAELSSSVNHGLLCKSTLLTLACDLSNPLKWNGLHTWTFQIEARDVELFFLREHVFLLSDLIADWGTGPPSDYYTFTPMRYAMEIRALNLQLYLNVNDSNIIDNPCSLDDNTFIVVRGPELSCNVTIPLDKYRSEFTEVPFRVKTSHGGIDLHTPPWKTQSAFLRSKEVGTVEGLSIAGRYHVYARTSSTLADTLVLDIDGTSPTLKLFGFVIRYFLILKENYFGEQVHFKTLEEYQALQPSDAKGSVGGHKPARHHSLSNDLDVILTVTANDTSLLLPANLYSADEGIQISLASLDVDMRFTNYYMDLMVNFSPLSTSHRMDASEDKSNRSATNRTQAFVDGVDIYAHRLFGLPPTEPTYMCNWDFHVGAISGECSTAFLRALAHGGRNFGFTFDDDENALPVVDAESIVDVTFLRARLQPVSLRILTDSGALELKTDEATFQFNDWATATLSSRLDMSLPGLLVMCTESGKISPNASDGLRSGSERVLLESSVDLTVMQTKKEPGEQSRLQQQFIEKHDQRTARTPFLLRMSEHLTLPEQATGRRQVPVTMPLPGMPQPIFDSDLLLLSSAANHASIPGNEPTGSIYENSVSEADSVNSGSVRVNRQAGTKAASMPKDRTSGQLNREASGGSSSQSSSPSRRRGSRVPGLLGPATRKRNTSPAKAISSSFLSPFSSFDPLLIGAHRVAGSRYDATPEPGYEKDPTAPLPQLEEGRSHTAVLLRIGAGSRVFADPLCISSIIQVTHALLQSSNEGLLDQFQVDILSRVLDFGRGNFNEPSTLNLQVKLPDGGLRFWDDRLKTTAISERETKDEYEAQLSGLSLSARFKTDSNANKSSPGLKKLTSLHVSLDSASFSVGDRHGGSSQAQFAIGGTLDEALFWLHQQDKTSASLQLRLFEIVGSSEKARYLAKLVDHVSAQVKRASAALSLFESNRTDRLRGLVHELITAGAVIPDPTSLTRPSSVLRSAPDHLRLSDSWKIITRLRQIFYSLPPEKRSLLPVNIQGIAGKQLMSARNSLIHDLNRWGSWELADANRSYIVQTLYELEDVSAPPQENSWDGRVIFNAGLLKLLLDPGPKQSQLEIESLLINATNTAPAAAGGSPASDGSSFPSSIFEVYTAQLVTRFDWSICNLTEVLLEHYAAAEIKATAPSDPAQQSEAIVSRAHDYQLVLIVDVATLTIESLNFRSVSICKDFQTSAMWVVGRDAPFGLPCFSVQLATLSSEITSPSQGLVSLSLLRHRLCLFPPSRAAHEHPEAPFRVTADSQHLSITIGEDLSRLTETVEMIIGEEVAQVHRLAQTFGTVEAELPQVLANKPASTTEMSVLVSLDSYSFDIAMLSSLSYSVAGTSVRLSVRTGQDTLVGVEIDLGKQVHRLVLLTELGPEALSHIKIPPVNGQLTTSNSNLETAYQIQILVGDIKIDAAMISKLLLTMSRPEVFDTIKETLSDVQLIKARLDDILVRTDTKVQKPSNAGRPVTYDCILVFAGIAIHGSVPSQADKFEPCIVEIDLGVVEMKASNRVLDRDGYLDSPEVQLDLEKVSAKVIRREGQLLQPCGYLEFDIHLKRSPQAEELGIKLGLFTLRVGSLRAGIYAETPAYLLVVTHYLRNSVKDVDFAREKRYLRRLRKFKRSSSFLQYQDRPDPSSSRDAAELVGAELAFEILDARVSWHTEGASSGGASEPTQDLVLSFKRAYLATRKEKAARLNIESLQLEMRPKHADGSARSLNSALLPEIIFNVAYNSTRHGLSFMFQAAGRSLDLRLTSHFIIPAAAIRRSVVRARKMVTLASLSRHEVRTHHEAGKDTVVRNKRPVSVFIDADFAGAVVHLQDAEQLSSSDPGQTQPPRGDTQPDGRFPRNLPKSKLVTLLRTPGVALKLEYKDDFLQTASIDAEMKVDSSTNTLYPTFVPIIKQFSSSIQEVISESHGEERDTVSETSSYKSTMEESIFKGDPGALLGRFRLNLGLRICRQDFSLSCEPMAELTVTAGFELIYITVNTVVPSDHNRFFAITAMFSGVEASIQHLYSRESTGRFKLETLLLSMMNSRHLNGVNGISAMLKVSPAQAFINARQVQDFFLFHDLWLPTGLNEAPAPKHQPASKEPHAHLIQRYQQVTAAAAFPWNAAVVFEELNVQLDLGRALGKSSFVMSNLWISSQKSSDWEQNLCLGFGEVSISGSGRLSGFVDMRQCKVRTSIEWPSGDDGVYDIPLIQASVAFDHLRVQTAFDYQVFLVADCNRLSFYMYNVRNDSSTKVDRLVGILEGDGIQAYTTATCAAQMAALYQAIVRLVQEKRAAYEAALLPFNKRLARQQSRNSIPEDTVAGPSRVDSGKAAAAPLSLNSNVMIHLREVSCGVFPNTLFDNQLFKVEMFDAQARFAVSVVGERVHGKLGLTLGRLRVAVSSLRRSELPSKIEEDVVSRIIKRAADSREGTILQVPRVLASMQTWHALDSSRIEYTFKSAFEGKVDVGWNYSRIGFIRNLWSNHSRALEQRLGKPSSQSTVKLSGGRRFQSALPETAEVGESTTTTTITPGATTTTTAGTSNNTSNNTSTTGTSINNGDNNDNKGKPEKITAVVNVPQSKYSYHALEPPIIETPQLRDMGEATPPLEWIGLHRDRLPNLTHQLVIVALMKMAKEVEDAYSKILGSL